MLELCKGLAAAAPTAPALAAAAVYTGERLCRLCLSFAKALLLQLAQPPLLLLLLLPLTLAIPCADSA
jgi:hypothetical protein